MWKPKLDGTSAGSGSVTIGGRRQRFVVLPNHRKSKDGDPDFLLMSDREPEADTFRATASQGERGGAA
jgi:hypothetical protein